MVTFAAAAARLDARWCIMARVEGLGTYAGQYVFCDHVPTYAAANALYVPYLRQRPQPISERSSPLGGVPEAGSATIEVVDVDDLLTSILQDERAPITRLSAPATAVAATMTLQDGSATPAASVRWIGSEAVRFVSISAGTTYNVTRAWLGTTAVEHELRAGVFDANPYVRTRKLQIYIAPQDGDDATTELLLGEYSVASEDLSDDLSAWLIGGSTQLQYLARLVAEKAIRLKVNAAYGGGDMLWWAEIPGIGDPIRTLDILRMAPWPDAHAFVKVGGEIVRVSATDTQPIIQERACAGTRRHSIEPGEIITQVLTTHPPNDFKYSPGGSPSVDRASGTWLAATHFTDLILCVLTSAASRDDGLELLNYSGADGNYSALPPGFGCGLPAAAINFASFRAVKYRTPDLVFPAAVLGGGDKAETAAGWIERNFLKPAGAFLANVSGQLQIILPRLPMAGETATAIGSSDIIALRKAGRSMKHLAGSITYELPDGQGATFRRTFRSSDFAATFGQRGQYQTDSNPISVPMPGLIYNQPGINALLNKLALRALLRFSRPLWSFQIDLDLSFYALDVGQLVSLTHAQIPDRTTGTRGVSGMICQITERSIVFDAKRGYLVRIGVLGYGSGFKVARVGPAGVVVSSAVNGSDRDVVVVPNRYTSPDAQYAGLPADDSAAFEVGQVVQEKTRAGVLVGSPRTVTNVNAGTDTVRISGTGAPTVGNVLMHAGFANATADQRLRFAFWGAESTGLVTAGVTNYRFGEG